MTACPSIAYIIAEGREVAMIPCTLQAGHDVADPGWPSEALPGLMLGVREATPHAHTLTWTNPEGLLDSWPDYADPDEGFDLEVDIAPAEVLETVDPV